VLPIRWTKFETYEKLIDEFNAELKTHEYLIVDFSTVVETTLQQCAKLEDLKESLMKKALVKGPGYLPGPGVLRSYAVSHLLVSDFRQVRGLAGLVKHILIHRGQGDHYTV